MHCYCHYGSLKPTMPLWEKGWMCECDTICKIRLVQPRPPFWIKTLESSKCTKTLNISLKIVSYFNKFRQIKLHRYCEKMYQTSKCGPHVWGGGHGKREVGDEGTGRVWGGRRGGGRELRCGKRKRGEKWGEGKRGEKNCGKREGGKEFCAGRSKGGAGGG